MPTGDNPVWSEGQKKRIVRDAFRLPEAEREALVQSLGPDLFDVLRFISAASPDDQDIIRRADMRRRAELTSKP